MLMPLRKAAEHVGYTPESLRKFIRTGRLKAVRINGGHYRVSDEALKLLIEDGASQREGDRAGNHA